MIVQHVSNIELLADTPSVQGLGAPPSPSRGGILFFPNDLRHRTSASLGSNSSQYGVPLSRAPATFTGDFALKLDVLTALVAVLLTFCTRTLLALKFTLVDNCLDGENGGTLPRGSTLATYALVNLFYTAVAHSMVVIEPAGADGSPGARQRLPGAARRLPEPRGHLASVPACRRRDEGLRGRLRRQGPGRPDAHGRGGRGRQVRRGAGDALHGGGGSRGRWLGSQEKNFVRVGWSC